jgi:glycosyltransferase involved in cell wall biosynthesis
MKALAAIRDRIRIAVLFDYLGPYHLARLGAALRACDVYAVEISGRSGDYAWAPGDGLCSVERHTMFQREDGRKRPAREVASGTANALGRLAPEVVAIPGWSAVAALAALYWALGCGVPVVIMSESTADDEPRRIWKESLKRQVIASCSSALVGGTPQFDYLRRLGMASEKIFTGYDAVDNEYFADASAKVRRDAARVGVRLGLPVRYFLASSRFVEKKNLLRLLDGYAVYRKLHGQQDVEPWSLVILGDGPLAGSIRSRIRELAIGDAVMLPGFKQYPDLPAFYGLAGAFVHASTTEQWGLVVNEAMASALPVIVSKRCGCAPDLVRDGENGFVFDPLNNEQLARLMLRVAGGQADRERMGAASARIIRDWGLERFAEGLRMAAECAQRVGPPKPSPFVKALLTSLMYRKYVSGCAA